MSSTPSPTCPRCWETGETSIRFDSGTVAHDGNAVAGFGADKAVDGTWISVVNDYLGFDEKALKRAPRTWDELLGSPYRNKRQARPQGGRHHKNLTSYVEDWKPATGS